MPVSGGTLTLFWWRYRIAQLLWRTGWCFLVKLNINLPYKPIQGIYPRKAKACLPTETQAWGRPGGDGSDLYAGCSPCGPTAVGTCQNPPNYACKGDTLLYINYTSSNMPKEKGDQIPNITQQTETKKQKIPIFPCFLKWYHHSTPSDYDFRVPGSVWKGKHLLVWETSTFSPSFMPSGPSPSKNLRLMGIRVQNVDT